MGRKQADIVADASTSCSVCSYVVEVAEICRIDGTVEGGFSVPCSCGKAADMVVDELLDELSREVLTEEFPFYSLKWNIRKVREGRYVHHQAEKLQNRQRRNFASG